MYELNVDYIEENELITVSETFIELSLVRYRLWEIVTKDWDTNKTIVIYKGHWTKGIIVEPVIILSPNCIRLPKNRDYNKIDTYYKGIKNTEGYKTAADLNKDKKRIQNLRADLSFINWETIKTIDIEKNWETIGVTTPLSQIIETLVGKADEVTPEIENLILNTIRTLNHYDMVNTNNKYFFHEIEIDINKVYKNGKTEYSIELTLITKDYRRLSHTILKTDDVPYRVFKTGKDTRLTMQATGNRPTTEVLNKI